jgi:hypothetical protein
MKDFVTALPDPVHFPTTVEGAGGEALTSCPKEFLKRHNITLIWRTWEGSRSHYKGMVKAATLPSPQRKGGYLVRAFAFITNQEMPQSEVLPVRVKQAIKSPHIPLLY